eukprot:1709862-Pyramimonas_sp.AAC.1
MGHGDEGEFASGTKPSFQPVLCTTLESETPGWVNVFTEKQEAVARARAHTGVRMFMFGHGHAGNYLELVLGCDGSIPQNRTGQSTIVQEGEILFTHACKRLFVSMG